MRQTHTSPVGNNREQETIALEGQMVHASFGRALNQSIPLRKDEGKGPKEYIRTKNQERAIELSQGLKKFHFVLVAFIIAFTSYHIYDTTVRKLNNSRNYQRAFNVHLLEHDSLDIYWYGYRVGQQLINYPIQEYYFLDDISDFLTRLEDTLGNLQNYAYGPLDQQTFNQTTQYIEFRDRRGNGEILQWDVENGLDELFNTTDTEAIKELFLERNRAVFTIRNQEPTSNANKHKNKKQAHWKLQIFIETFENTSFFVTVLFDGEIDMMNTHISTFVLGLLLSCSIYAQIRVNKSIKLIPQEHQKIKKGKKIYNMTGKILVKEIGLQSMPDIMLSFLLLYTSTSYMLGVLGDHSTLILDGVGCLVAWLYLLKLFTHDDDYHISFLIKKSYLLVGRMFVSFGPVFVGFVLFAHAIFCRYGTLFDSFHKSFMSLFCISYYNMTYEGFRSTEKSDPISAIFFTLFVLLFTGCVYSGMLVSVFCSYVWNKRDEKNKEDLLQSLKMECTNCGHKYMYTEGLKLKDLKGNYIQSDGFIQSLAKNIQSNHYCRAKYKEILIYRVKVLTELIIENYLEEIRDYFEEEATPAEINTIQQCIRGKKKPTRQEEEPGDYHHHFDKFYESLEASLKKAKELRNIMGQKIASQQRARSGNSPKIGAMQYRKYSGDRKDA